ncbi:uncharacterized LabA/DUF88 family protein [Sinorhizobium fredii]
MVIDAMYLLHSGRFDGFCLVSSDSDFTRLAARIREQGVDVFGFGEQKTPESFRQACRWFVYTENLLPGAIKDEQNTSSVDKTLQSANADVRLIKKVLSQEDTEDGWVNLGTVGKQLLNLAPDFDPRAFGFRKLSDLIRETNQFEVRQAEGGPSVSGETTKQKVVPPPGDLEGLGVSGCGDRSFGFPLRPEASISAGANKSFRRAPTLGKTMMKGRRYGDRYGRVVQRSEGLRFHPAGRRQRRCLRSHFRGGASRNAWSERRPEDHL